MVGFQIPAVMTKNMIGERIFSFNQLLLQWVDVVFIVDLKRHNFIFYKFFLNKNLLQQSSKTASKRFCFSCWINAPGEQAVVFIDPLQWLPFHLEHWLMWSLKHKYYACTMCWIVVIKPQTLWGINRSYLWEDI